MEPTAIEPLPPAASAADEVPPSARREPDLPSGPASAPRRIQALVVGRALHAPWNEGTRVIGYQTARAIALHADVATVSLTNREYGPEALTDVDVDHVLTRHAYGTLGDYLNLPRLIRRVLTTLRAGPVDVAHLIGAPLVLAPLLKRRGSKVVAHVTLTSQAYLPRADRVRAWLGWRLFDSWIDAWACSSDAVRDALRDRGLPSSKLHVIPPPVDVVTYAPGKRAIARKVLNLPATTFAIGYVGTVSPLRFPTRAVLTAVRRAARATPDVRLEIHAPTATHPYNLAWSRQIADDARRAGVTAAIRLQDLTSDEKIAAYRGADVLVFPFAAPVAVEPPLTLLEGMACGAIALVTPLANRSGLVVNGRNGFTWSSPDELAEALVHVARLPASERNEISTAARATIVNRHAPSMAADAIRDLWSRIGVWNPADESQTARRPMRVGRRRPRGLTVAVVGPDGAGKSALVARLAAQPDLAGLAIYMGVDRRKATHSLPTTRWLVRRAGRRRSAGEPGGRPVSNRRSPPSPTNRPLAPRHPLRLFWRAGRNALALPHEVVEFGYRYLVGWRARRRGMVVLFDRYPYDQLVDCTVDQLGWWPRLRAQLLAALIPAPDVVLLLVAPGTVLLERKGEHDVARLDAITAVQRRIYGELARVVELDALQPSELVAEEAHAILAGELAARADGSSG